MTSVTAYAVVGPDGDLRHVATTAQEAWALSGMPCSSIIVEAINKGYTVAEVNIATECRWKDVAGSHYLGGCGICYRDDFDYSFCPQCGGKVVVEGAG